MNGGILEIRNANTIIYKSRCWNGLQITGLLKIMKKIQYKTTPYGQILKDLLKDYCKFMLTMVIRKSIFEELNISFNNQYQIIGDFAFSISVAEKKVNVVQEPIAYYRKHSEVLPKGI